MDYKKDCSAKNSESNENNHHVPVQSRADFSLSYAPEIADQCLAIEENPEKAYELTNKQNLIAVISNGTAVLGLGDIGSAAVMPVLEIICTFFKEIADINAVPLTIQTKDVDTVVQTIEQVSGGFGGIHLEDIAAPACFAIEKRLRDSLAIPVFHNDQHGTAIVVAAGLINALNLVGKSFGTSKIIINGAGTAGIAIAKHLMSFNVKDILLVDEEGILTSDTPNLTDEQEEIIAVTNVMNQHGHLDQALVDADVFIGVSVGAVLTGEMIQKMKPDPIIFALATPIPEIMPEKALKAGAAVVATGRSDFANQINTILAFPGIFKGALSVRAYDINEPMKVAASRAIASLVTENELKTDYILPTVWDTRVCPAVATAVKEAAIHTRVNRISGEMII